MSEAGFVTGCLSFIFTGVGHLSAELFMRLSQNASYQELPTVRLMGASLTMHQLSTGFSYAMGLLLISLGLSYLIGRDKGRRLRLVALATSLIMLAVSVQYFFIVPIAIMTLASLSFSLSFLKFTRREVAV